MILNETYFKVENLEEASLLAMANKENFRFLAGGTDVLVNKFQGNDDAVCLIDISEITEIQNITIENNCLIIGSAVKLSMLKNNKIIAEKFPALLQAVESAATPVLRKTATIGGNILCQNRCIFYNQTEWWRNAVGYCLKCNGDICIASGGKKNCYSKFVSDTAPVLIALNAKIEIIESENSIVIPLEDIYSGDGVKPVILSKTAILKSIKIPLDKNYTCVFKKLRPRKSVDFTSLTTAVSVDENGKIRIVLGGVDAKPILVNATLNDDMETLIKKAVKLPKIVDNDVYPRLYRKEMISVFLRRSFEELSI